MNNTQQLLAANRRFYEAFAASDYLALDRLIARSHPVTCIHPGWHPIVGRKSVMESWRAIFDHGGPDIRCLDPEAVLIGPVGLVLCLEQLPEGLLAASNAFVVEDEQWRLVHHQAGPAPDPIVAAPPGGTVH